MKHYLTVIFGVLALMIFLPAQVFAAGATLSLSPATGSFNKSCTFSLQIQLDTGGIQTDGTDAILTYDTTRFLANKINNGTIYSDYPGNNIDTVNGKITVSGLSSAGSAYLGTGVLATIDFTVLNSAPAGASKIQFDFDPNNKAKTTDSNVVEKGTTSEILNQVVDGNYVVGTGSCGGVGGSITPSVPTNPSGFVPTKVPLNKTADVTTTMVLVIIGSSLTMLGIFGLARL